MCSKAIKESVMKVTVVAMREKDRRLAMRKVTERCSQCSEIRLRFRTGTCPENRQARGIPQVHLIAIRNKHKLWGKSRPGLSFALVQGWSRREVR